MALLQETKEQAETYRNYRFIQCILPSYSSLNSTSIVGFNERKAINELYDYSNSDAFVDVLKEMYNFSTYSLSTQFTNEIGDSVSFAKIVALITNQYSRTNEDLTHSIFMVSQQSSFKEYAKFVFCNL